MKRLYSWILLCPIWAMAQTPVPEGTVLPRIGYAGQMVAAVIGATPLTAPPSYLIDESFEGTGTPSGWTITGGAGANVNFDWTNSAAHGSQSMRLSAASETASAITPTFAATTNVNLCFRYMHLQNPSSANRPILSIRNGTTELEVAAITTGGTILVNGGSATTDAVPTNTWVYVWMTYNTASGAATLGFSADGTKPTSGTKYTTASQAATTNATNIRLFANYVTASYTNHWDRVLVDDDAIGNNP